MKKILVLTDFSIRAAYAAEFALHIAQTNDSEIILCHVIELIRTVANDTGINPLMPDIFDLENESMLQLKELQNNLNQIILSNGSAFKYKPGIKSMAKFGILADDAQKLVDENNIDLLVIGSRRSNSISRFLLGSKTHKLLDSVNCPVLLIPEALKYDGIKNITYATDLPLNNRKALRYLGDFAKFFKATITVNYLSKHSSTITKTDEEIKRSLNEQLEEGYPNVLYHTLKGHQVIGGLVEMLGTSKVNVLVMVHKKYELMQGLLHASLSKKMADKSFVPLLILPNYFISEEALFTNSQLEHFCFDTSDSR